LPAHDSIIQKTTSLNTHPHPRVDLIIKMSAQIEEMWASFQRQLDMDLDPAEKRTQTPNLQPQYPVPKPQQPQPEHTPASYPNVIPLNIGGRRFEVARSTLCESRLLQHQLSDQSAWSPESDGWYFLDTDPEIFEHLLRFMRRPSAFPLFWSQSEGFDYGLYHRVQTDAEYFQLDALHEWIKTKKYLTGVTVHISPPRIEEVEQVVEGRILGNCSEDWQVVSLHFAYSELTVC
jgi:hypothetical protein